MRPCLFILCGFMFLGIFCTDEFQLAFNKLVNFNQFMNAPVIFRLVDAGKVIREEFAKYTQTRDKLLEQYADRDEKNVIVRKEIGNGFEFSMKKHGDEFTKALSDLNNTDIPSIPVFTWAELRQRDPATKEEFDVPLSPRDLIDLGDLIRP